MADFYITWPSSHVRGSPGINVGHGAYHPGLAECRLVASREVSLRLCLFTRVLRKGRETSTMARRLRLNTGHGNGL